MRILVVNEYAGKLGGVEQYLANIVPALRQRGHQVALLYERLAPREGSEFLGLFDHHYQDLDAALADFEAEVLFLHRVSTIQPYLELAQRRVRYVHDHDLCCPRRHKYYVWNGQACHHKADWRCWLDLAFVRRDRAKPLGLAWVSLADHQQELRAHQKLDALLVRSSLFLFSEPLQQVFEQCVVLDDGGQVYVFIRLVGLSWIAGAEIKGRDPTGVQARDIGPGLLGHHGQPMVADPVLQVGIFQAHCAGRCHVVDFQMGLTGHQFFQFRDRLLWRFPRCEPRV